jgi:hypothetical protein
VTPGGADRAIQDAFQFEGPDLVANRAGRLSPRQVTLLRAGRIGMRLSLAVFACVMLGSVGLVAFFNLRLGAAGGWSDGLGVAAAVAAAVIVGSFLLSRRHLAATRPPRVLVAHGLVQVLSDADANCRVRIGTTTLRFPSAAHLEVFQPHTEYRVYYLPGPSPIVLSAETRVVPGGSAAHDATATGDVPGTAARDQLAVFRRGYLILVLLGVLALGIPVAGVLVGSLPPGLRPLAWIVLVAVSIGFVWLALAWLGSGKHRQE